MMPVVRSFHHFATGTWTHVVVDAATRRAAIIDPVLDFELASGAVSQESARRVLEYIDATDLTVEWILETHAHADHLTAADWLKRELSARQASVRPQTGIGVGIVNVQRTFKKLLNLADDFVANGSQFDRLFADGDRFRIGELDVRVIATPGHTPDSLTYLICDSLFIGDTLFAPSAGSARCDFPDGDAATLYRSIRTLYDLPDVTRVFLAHDYPGDGNEPRSQTTIAAQKGANIHVRADTPEDEYVRLRTARDATLAAPKLLWPALQVNIRAGRLPVDGKFVRVG